MKKKKIKKNRIILIFCTILVCLCSVISFIPFKQDKLVVRADTIGSSGFTFQGSKILVPSSPTLVTDSSSFSTRPSNNLLIYFANISFSFVVDDNGYLSSYSVNGSLLNNYVNSDNQYDTHSEPINYTSSFITNGTLNNDYYYSYVPYIVYQTTSSPVTTLYLCGMISCSSSSTEIIDNTLRFKFGKPISVNIATGTGFGSMMTHFRYNDADNNWLRFSLFFPKHSNFTAYSSSKTYYFSDTLNLTDNQYYNQGFSAGQSQGYNNGYSAGESFGYNEGYNVGQTNGYNNGYTDGVEDSNQYTFLNLLSATIDAPVKYFQSLFNFELLGVNLQGFLTGLFTLCVVVTIFKLCLGG